MKWIIKYIIFGNFKIEFFFKIKILFINMSESNISIYEKILKRIQLTTVNESIEKIQKELDDTKKDVKMFEESIENLEYLSAKYCEEYVDDIDDEYYQEYSLMLNTKNNLDKKKNILQKELKNIEEKYNKALEDKQIIDFLKKLIDYS